MPGSFKNVDYRIRPSKNIERKFMVEILSQLSHIRPLGDYQYIGFGSTYFSDFKMFHRRLKIDQMTSIEMEAETEREKKRFQWNKPFKCIDVKFGRSDEELPLLNLEKPTILWLDYEQELKRYMFNDIEQFCASAPVGSVLFVTVNAQPMNHRVLGESNYETRNEKLEQKLGEDNIPPKVTDMDLRKWGKGDAFRDIIIERIKTDFLKPRNDGREVDISFRQLVNYRYKDSERMMTLGGMLYSEEISEEYQDSAIEDIDHVTTGENHVVIETPKLTFAEMRKLDKSLPGSIEESEVPVDDEDKKSYARFYKYFPRFSESEI